MPGGWLFIPTQYAVLSVIVKVFAVCAFDGGDEMGGGVILKGAGTDGNGRICVTALQ